MLVNLTYEIEDLDQTLFSDSYSRLSCELTGFGYFPSVQELPFAPFAWFLSLADAYTEPSKLVTTYPEAEVFLTEQGL